MNKIKSSDFNKELAHLHSIMKSQKAFHTLPEYISKYPSWLIKDVKSFLNSGKLTSLKIGDLGCYDATVLESGKELYVEVNFDDNDFLEDCYCTCNTGLCVHLAAVLWKINEELNVKTDSYYSFLN